MYSDRFSRGWENRRYHELLLDHFLPDEAKRLSRASGGFDNRGIQAIREERRLLYNSLVRKYYRGVSIKTGQHYINPKTGKRYTQREAREKAMSVISRNTKLQIIDIHSVIQKLILSGRLRAT